MLENADGNTKLEMKLLTINELSEILKVKVKTIYQSLVPVTPRYYKDYKEL